ncbi:hypothetical protein BCR42DRAFT_435431 [Absidia repens]|uniref:Uncharacterized protein n=1 Tax=Absidia repens TaxID=90262 RepID=A0A1X2IPY3_9FUNG|nr:hypothetical protein BCR42DRAFT_435431 [Absidia repens]
MQFSFNWDLICNVFNSIRTPLVGGKRTPWELYELRRGKNLTTLSGQVNQGYANKLESYLSKLSSTVKFDSLRKKEPQYGIFEAIKKTHKERKENQGSTPTKRLQQKSRSATPRKTRPVIHQVRYPSYPPIATNSSPKLQNNISNNADHDKLNQHCGISKFGNLSYGHHQQ